MDYTLAGKRVRARYTIPGHANIPKDIQGTIQWEQDNGVGDMLVYVFWDGSIGRVPVLHRDIEILDTPVTET